MNFEDFDNPTVTCPEGDLNNSPSVLPPRQDPAENGFFNGFTAQNSTEKDLLEFDRILRSVQSADQSPVNQRVEQAQFGYDDLKQPQSQENFQPRGQNSSSGSRNPPQKYDSERLLAAESQLENSIDPDELALTSMANNSELLDSQALEELCKLMDADPCFAQGSDPNLEDKAFNQARFVTKQKTVFDDILEQIPNDDFAPHCSLIQEAQSTDNYEERPNINTDVLCNQSAGVQRNSDEQTKAFMEKEGKPTNDETCIVQPDQLCDPLNPARSDKYIRRAPVLDGSVGSHQVSISTQTEMFQKEDSGANNVVQSIPQAHQVPPVPAPQPATTHQHHQVPCPYPPHALPCNQSQVPVNHVMPQPTISGVSNLFASPAPQVPVNPMMSQPTINGVPVTYMYQPQTATAPQLYPGSFQIACPQPPVVQSPQALPYMPTANLRPGPNYHCPPQNYTALPSLHAQVQDQVVTQSVNPMPNNFDNPAPVPQVQPSLPPATSHQHQQITPQIAINAPCLSPAPLASAAPQSTSTTASPSSVRKRRAPPSQQVSPNTKKRRPVAKAEEKTISKAKIREQSFSSGPHSKNFLKDHHRMKTPLVESGFVLHRVNRIKCFESSCQMEHLIPNVFEKPAKTVMWHNQNCPFFKTNIPCSKCVAWNGVCRGCENCQ